MPGISRPSAILCLSAIMATATLTHGGETIATRFHLSHQTTPGTSVFLLGDLPELGGNQPERAVKLHPGFYPDWQVTIALPPDTDYSYRYCTRLDGADDLSDPANISFLSSSPLTGRTPPRQTPLPATGKRLLYHSGWSRVWVAYLDAAGNRQEVEMQAIGAGRIPGENLFEAQGIGEWNMPLAFHFRDEAGNLDQPPYGADYATTLNGALVQDGEVFAYKPVATPSTPRIENYQDFPSSDLGNARTIRVYLPRGYDDHVAKRYPVLYMHDGQNIFAPGGPFGSWDADLRATDLIARGQLPELIIVGIDNAGADRIVEYSPPESQPGTGDLYGRFLVNEVMPFIDANYRTLQGPRHTGVMGSSMGGLISLYLGWEYPHVFRHLGCLSSAFWRSPELAQRVATEAPRDVRIYLDSGDSGSFTNDGLWGTIDVRDDLLKRGYVLGENLLHYIDYGAIHNEPAWAGRVHIPLLWMFGILEWADPANLNDAPTPTPMATASPTTAPSPSPTFAPTASPTPSPSPTSPGATPTPLPTATPTMAPTGRVLLGGYALSDLSLREGGQLLGLWLVSPEVAEATIGDLSTGLGTLLPMPVDGAVTLELTVPPGAASGAYGLGVAPLGRGQPWPWLHVSQ